MNIKENYYHRMFSLIKKKTTISEYICSQTMNREKNMLDKHNSQLDRIKEYILLFSNLFWKALILWVIIAIVKLTSSLSQDNMS